jgi:hypothetical protein
MSARPLLRAALLTLALVSPSVCSGEEPALKIGQIRIRALDVFSPEEASRGWVYRLANSLRFETRESVIREFLLFREGEPYDPARLSETERNLRTLPFLKSASVTASDPHDDLVDVDVVTQDAWTTEPGINFGGKGGTTTYSFDLKEKDFLGRGRQVAVAYQKGIDRITRLVQYQDPYLFGPYWGGLLRYAENSDGSEQLADLSRPFYSFVAPWSTTLVVDHLIQDERVYSAGDLSGIFHQKHWHSIVDYGWALEASDERARRLRAGFRLQRDEFFHAPDRPQDVLPDDRKFRYVFLRYEEAVNDFLKRNYINRDSRYEDFELGLNYSVEFAVSPAALGADRTTEFVKVGAAQGLRLTPGSFLQGSVAYQTRLDSGVRNEMVSASLFFARRFSTDLLQTLVARLQFDRGWRLDRDVQFVADGDNGLRGYSLHAFTGDRRILCNVEQRFFSGREFFQLISPGAVVFFDTGTAVSPGKPMRLSDFKTDVGLGLRFSISRAASNSVVRIDFAYPLDRDFFGRRRLLVSFSSGQVF